MEEEHAWDCWDVISHKSSPTASSLAMMFEEQNPRDFCLQEIPPPSLYLGDREQNPGPVRSRA